MKPYALFPRTPGLFSSLNVQKSMLRDSVRNESFRETIFRSVTRSDVVVDLGTGTGILAIWAAKAGARRVYAIEETDVAEVAEAVIKDNGFDDVITVLKANSSEVTLPEPADVLIAELVGHFLFEEGIVEAIAGAREALLKPRARIIPSAATVFMAPVDLGASFEEVSYWTTWKDPVLSRICKQAANTTYVETVSPQALLAQPCQLFDIDFATANAGLMETSSTFKIARDGTLNGLAGWFQLDLGQGVSISTSPWNKCTHWQQCVFPLEKPVAVMKSATLSFSIAIEPFADGSKWHWSISSQGFEESHSVLITYRSDLRLLNERF